MNHYPHHIGDFNTATRHLSRLERAVYRDALDMYYDSEAPLDGSDFDRLARRLLCRDAEEVAALQFVLEEFFEHQDDGTWAHHRCDREIAKFKDAQADAGVVKSNEKQRQTRSRAVRSAIFSALRAKGVEVKWNSRMGDMRALCRQHGVDLSAIDSGTASGTACAVAGGVTVSQRHGSGTANQNQNHNHIKPPNPPAGGADDSAADASQERDGGGGAAQMPAATATVTAAALCAFFPEIRRTRLAEVATCIAALEADGTVTGEQLLKAAAQQSEHLCRDAGKACPSVLRWLREQRWLDAAVGASQAGAVPADWRQTRSGVEAMGERLGLGRWDESRHRLFAQYEDEVVAALDGQTVGG
jgi:uncharacterized protein YdaU (DUF1376 family)